MTILFTNDKPASDVKLKCVRCGRTDKAINTATGRCIACVPPGGDAA